MKSNTHYDVIIVGGGPAGSTAGYLLANFGYSVLIFDKKTFPRDKLCGGLTTYKTRKLLERIFDETETSLIEQNIFDFSALKYELRYKSRFMFERDVALPFYFVKRIVYDDFLLNKAKDAGVTVKEGAAVVSCDLSQNVVVTASGDMYQGKFIVGADGVNSRVRREFPENRTKYQTKWQQNLCACFELYINRDDPALTVPKNIDYPILEFGAVDMGYAWLFPRQKEYVIGLGGIHVNNREQLLKAFYKHVAGFGINNPRQYNFKAYHVPCGGHIKRPIFKNALLVGDAGGMVDPLLGEGIFYGQRSAELAAWSLHRYFQYGARIDREYPKLLWKYVYSEFINAKILRFLGFYVAEKFNHLPTKLLFRMIPEALVDVLHGVRTSKGLRKREDFHERVDL